MPSSLLGPTLRVVKLSCSFAALLLALFVSFVPPCDGQSTSQLSGADSTPVAGHDYLGSPAETVNPADGSLSIRIKVPVPPGRKLTLPVSLAYDSKGSSHIWYGWYYTIPALSRVAKQYAATSKFPDGSIDCLATLAYMFYDSSGAPHPLGLSNVLDYWVLYEGQNQETMACKQSGFGTLATSSNGDDGTGGPYAATLLNASQTDPAGNFYPGASGSPEIAGPDGTVYKFVSTASSDWGCNPNTTDNVSLVPFNNGLVSSIEDRNGNTINVTETCAPPPGAPGAPNVVTGFTATDSAGRTLMSASNNGTNGSTLSVSGLGGNYTQGWTTLTGTAGPTLSSTPITSINQGDPHCPAGMGGGGLDGEPFPAMTSLGIPNGQSYGFQYDTGYVQPNKITYPSGGYVSYQWGVDPQSQLVSYREPILGFTCQYINDTIANDHRYVFDGQTLVLQQDFSYSPTQWDTTNPWQWDTKTTTVTTHDLVRGTSYQTVYTYKGEFADANGLYGSIAQIPLETQIQYSDTNGTLLQTVNKAWLSQYELFCELTQVGSNGPLAGAFYAYGTGDQVTDKREFTFGQLSSPTVCQNGNGMPATTPARETVTNYQPFGSTPTYPATSIVDKPCQIIVYGSGTRVAETDTLYDGGTTVCGTAGTGSVATANSPVQHDSAYAYTVLPQPSRGNGTSITKLCLQSSPTCSSASVTTTYTYDETGQAVSMTDPKGNLTKYSFADSYSTGTPPGQTNSYLTKVTYPTTNGTAHILNYQYGYADGQRTVSTDENSQNTTFKYADNFGRLTETDYPDGGKTFFTYNDGLYNPNSNPPLPSITTQKLINTNAGNCTSTSGNCVISVAAIDGLGHAVKTELTSDNQGTIYTAAVYDGLGRAYKQYNPTRCNPPTTNCNQESSWGFTTYVYDALGRTTSVTKPDNSVVTTNYCNVPSSTAVTSSVLVTDEAGRWRRSQSDGLGRLVEVDEPNSASASVGACVAQGDTSSEWQTTYAYDALDDLIGVVQGGTHSRSFTYNSLKQLTQSTNPEAGTINYTYDANGNVSTKSDARNITTNYSPTASPIDALNRVTQITYSDGTTPTVSYTFDQSACLGQPTCYNIGHRTTMTDAGGTENLAYDQMGRELIEQRTTNSITKSVAYAYDKAGDLTSLTYPSGHVLTYTYDLAGRPSLLQYRATGLNFAFGTCANGTGTNDGACYAPQGAISQIEAGSNPTLMSAYIYNNRLQPCWMYATTGSAVPASTSCTSSDPGPGNILDLQYNFNAGQDNGNVIGITNNRNTLRSQTFAYDQVNRIISGQSNATYSTSTTLCWGETFTYDQWANMYAIGVVSSAYNGCTQDYGNDAVNANNQLVPGGFTYDAAGNLLTDNQNTYAYNAESEIKSAAGVNYTYDGDGNRVEKSNGKLYWYGAGTQILEETDLSGNPVSDYAYFGGKRIARYDFSTGGVYFYEEDMLDSSRTIVQYGATSACYDADFNPFGTERPVTSTCPQNYKFQGKERDTETNNDDFGARYYSSRLGRWLSADWSSVPKPVPYANLTNPQTLNLYAIVSDNPESFADLDGHAPPLPPPGA